MTKDHLSPTESGAPKSAEKTPPEGVTTNEAIIDGNHIKRIMLPENDMSLKRIIMVYKPEEDKFITKLDFSGADKEEVRAHAQIAQQTIQTEGA